MKKLGHILGLCPDCKQFVVGDDLYKFEFRQSWVVCHWPKCPPAYIKPPKKPLSKVLPLE